MNTLASSPSGRPSAASSRISSMQFSTQKHSRYIKMEQQKKLIAQTNFKGLVDKIMDKKNWRQRWSKIKTFIQNNRSALS